MYELTTRDIRLADLYWLEILDYPNIKDLRKKFEEIVESSIQKQRKIWQKHLY